MDFPPNALKFNFHQHLEINKTASRRVIDPRTNYQYEITFEDVNYICPICSHLQPAPPLADTDYQCPKCKWYYKAAGNLLVVFSPNTVKVPINALAPGQRPPTTVTESGSSDEDSVQAAHEKSVADWKAHLINEGEDAAWARKVQVLVNEAKKSK